MYQFNALGSPSASNSNFTTKLHKIRELTGIYTPDFFSP